MTDPKNDDLEELDADYVEEEYESGFLRWMSFFVVLAAVAGFIALAWYAYRTGTQSVGGEEVAVVEAPKAPIKEAPADPGGMQFPHQDKTVYDAISGGGSKSVAERVLPAPEEPMLQNKENSSTETWVSQKYNETEQKLAVNTGTGSGNVAEAVPAPVVSAPAPATEPVRQEAARAVEEVKKTIAEGEKQANTPPAAVTLKPVAETTPSEPVVKVETAQPVKTVEKKEPAKKPGAKEAKKSVGGKARVQLGAFKSEKEASAQWAKIYKANAATIGSYDHDIVRADLGAKGVFYRLQLKGVASKDAAKNLCARLQANKQACIVVQ